MGTCILENDAYRAVIAEEGAELVSVIDKSTGREYIWQASPDVWKRHAPVLFPLIGKYKDNTSYYSGRAYHMTQHGFARDMRFALVRADETEVHMCLSSSDETKEHYPFDFELDCGYRLDGNCLTASWNVRNPGTETMYFSIGGHPAFIGTGDSLADGALRFGVEGDVLRYGLLSADGLLEDKGYALSLDGNKTVALSKEFFDRDALIVENNQCGEVSLLQRGERIVTVTFDAPVFGLWSAARKNVPFVCIEPWYGRTDRVDFDGELTRREWANELAPGEVFEAEYQMSFGREVR